MSFEDLEKKAHSVFNPKNDAPIAAWTTGFTGFSLAVFLAFTSWTWSVQLYNYAVLFGFLTGFSTMLFFVFLMVWTKT